MGDEMTIEEYGEAFLTLDDDQKRRVYESAHRQNDRLRARVAALEADKARMREMLQPLVDAANDRPSHDPAWGAHDEVWVAVTVCDLRRVREFDARAELDAMKGGGDDG